MTMIIPVIMNILITKHAYSGTGKTVLLNALTMNVPKDVYVTGNGVKRRMHKKLLF